MLVVRTLLTSFVVLHCSCVVSADFTLRASVDWRQLASPAHDSVLDAIRGIINNVSSDLSSFVCLSVMQTYNSDSIDLHQLTCAIPDGTASTNIRLGYHVHDKPKDFTISLVPGHNVAIGPGQTPQLVTEQTLVEHVVDPDAIASYQQANGSVRLRSGGWKAEPFGFISQLLRATAAFPKHLTPNFSNATCKKTSSQQQDAEGQSHVQHSSSTVQHSSSTKAAAVSATGAAAATPLSPAEEQLHNAVNSSATATDAVSVPDLVLTSSDSRFVDSAAASSNSSADVAAADECQLSSQLSFRRWVFQKRPNTRPNEQCQALGIDVGKWQWGFIAGCIYHPHGCPARFLLGKRWNAGVLDVQFFGHCEHKIGVQAGRLAKSDRQLAVEEAQGRSTRQVFDRLQQRLSPDELLEGNVTRTGSNPAVIRKAVSEANRRAAAGSKGTGNPQQCKSASNRFAGELVQALQVCDDIKQRHQQQMANHRLKDKVTAWGYKQHFVDNDDGFSFTCFQEFSIQLWAGACGDNLRPCLYFDATGGQVTSVDGEKVFTSYCFMQHVGSAAEPFLAWDQVLPPILLVLLLGTLKTWEYVFAGMGKFFQLVAAASKAAAADDGGPCSRRYLPGCVFTDHDNAIINGWSRLVNLSRGATYRSVIRRLLLALADHVNRVCQLDASLAASGATALLMTHAQVVEMINRLAPMTSKQQKEHNSRAAAVASTMSTADDNTLDGIFAAMQPSAPMAMSAALKASAGLQDPLLQQPPTSAATDGELQQHAAAARLLLSILQWYVHLRLCAWHWIKACHDYGLYGAPFKDSPTSTRKYWAYILSIALGRPAVQTRFRGLTKILAGRLYLQGVSKLFNQKYLIAHPGMPVEQLDGLLQVRPGTAADIRPGSSSRGTPRWVVQAKHLLCSNGQPVQVRSHNDSVCEVSWTSADAPPDPVDSHYNSSSSSSHAQHYSGVQSDNGASSSGSISVREEAPPDVAAANSSTAAGPAGGVQFTLHGWHATATDQGDAKAQLAALFRTGTPMHSALTDNQLSAAGFVVLVSPFYCPPAKSYTDTALQDDIDVMAFQYLDELHPQLDNPFVQADGKVPGWAITNRNTARAEGGIKDSKHTQGAGSGPVSLSTFLQRQQALADGQARRYWSDMQHDTKLRQLSRRMQALQGRQLAYQQSESANTLFPLADGLGVPTALQSGMLPLSAAAATSTATGAAAAAAAAAQTSLGLHLPCNAVDGGGSAVEGVTATASGAISNQSSTGSMSRVSTGNPTASPATLMQGLSVDDRVQHAGSQVPFAEMPVTAVGIGEGSDGDMETGSPVKDDVTRWGPKRRRPAQSRMTESSLFTMPSDMDAPLTMASLPSQGTRQRPQRRAAMKLPDVLRTAGLVSDAPDHELPQETPIQEAKTGGTAGALQVQRSQALVGSSELLMASGARQSLRVGDHIVVRTRDKNNPYVFDTGASGSKYRVYVLQVLELEHHNADRRTSVLRGRGKWYLNPQKQINQPFQPAVMSDMWLSLNGHVVVMWGPDILHQLTVKQVAAVKKHVMDGL